jgi:hypothetical protein
VRLTKLVGGLAFGLALLGLSTSASAQYYGRRNADRVGNRLPYNYIERPLTLPGRVLEPQLELQSIHIPGTDVPSTANQLGGDEYRWNLNAGMAIGITPNFELQATFLPVQLYPNIQYGSPSAQATFRFAKQRGFEMGARLGLRLNTVPVETTTTLPAGSPECASGCNATSRSIALDSTTISAGFPLLLRFKRAARIDTGAFADFTLGQERTTTDALSGVQIQESRTIVGLRIPVDLSIALHHQAYMGVGSGLKIEDFSAMGDSFAIPFKVFAGFTVGKRRRPMLEINPYFEWDRMITPGQSRPTTPTASTPTTGERPIQSPTATNVPQDTFHENDWKFGLQLKGFLHF